MIAYIKVSSQQVGKDLSYALWSFTRPPQIRSAEEDEDDMFAVVQDAGGQWYLEVDTLLNISVHKLAEIDGIAGILLNAGISQTDVDQLEAQVIALRGQSMRPYDYFPAVFKDAAKTPEEMNWPSHA